VSSLFLLTTAVLHATRESEKGESILTQTQTATEQLSMDAATFAALRKDWNKFARDVLGVRLDKEQQEILRAVQNNTKVVVRSGNGRGKDYVAAVASIVFLQLYYPSKVIGTAPTGRQATSIMMAEVASVYHKANARLKELGYPTLGGEVLATRIKFDDPVWYMEVFKAADKDTEAWTGYHSPNIMVVVTEASGIMQETFDAIESLLTGNSRLFEIGNPNWNIGAFYEHFSDPQYVKFHMNSLVAPNVVAKQLIYPGQVDWDWVDGKVHKKGWASPIDAAEADTRQFDFQWEGRWYRPSDIFLIKVMGQFPRAGTDSLIPRPWLDAAAERWKKVHGKKEGPLLLGADIAGIGADNTVTAHRYGNIIEEIRFHGHITDHMEAAGLIKNFLTGSEDVGLIDTIGEGAGVFSRLEEQGQNVVSAKFSLSAEGLTDATEERRFLNMRAYCYWALRDALDPNLGGTLALPPCDELFADLACTKWRQRSNGKIFILAKDKIKEDLGRSPDWADAVALTFFPEPEFAIMGGFDASPRR